MKKEEIEEFKIDEKKPIFMIYKSISDEINKIKKAMKEIQNKIIEIEKGEKL